MPDALDHLLVDPDRDVDALQRALDRADVGLSPAVACTRTVLDTFDGRLHAAGLRLELRKGATSELVLLDRRGAPSAHLPATAAPTTPDELPAGPFRARLAAVDQERALLPVLGLSTRVRSGQRRDRRGKATVTVDVFE